jgi:2-polyprenyl-3-methyl-5-hydroxy-6-metoxy-1,4-benzoquinol methylase
MSKSKKFWDSASKNYDKTEERFEYIHHKSRENAKRHLESSNVVLDYGCGTGTTAIELANDVAEIYAIDISPKMIEISKSKAAEKSIKNVIFAEGDIFDKKLKKGSYDRILAFNMLHTITNPESSVQRIYELLKPDGLFISITPCLGDKMSFIIGLQIRLVQVMCKLGIIPVPIRRVKSLDLDELIFNGNFLNIDTEKIYQGASSYFMVSKKKVA